MKTEIAIAVWLIAGINSCESASLYAPPSKEQCEKLAAACKIKYHLPNSIDITFNKKLFRKPRSEDEIRHEFEQAFSQMDKPKDKMSDYELKQFEHNVQINVERTLKEESVGINTRNRVRLSEGRQRIDRITISPEEWNRTDISSAASKPGRDNSYDETFIIAETNQISCMPAMKVMKITKRTNKENENIDVYNITYSSLSGLRGMLTDRQSAGKSNCIISDEKVAVLVSTGKVDHTEVSIHPEPNAPESRVRIEMGSNGIISSIFICDKDDYSRVYYDELRGQSGKAVLIREYNDYDSNGIPQSAVVTEYDRDGSLKGKEIYRILNVNLNPAISKETFEFTPPEDYEIVEGAPDGVTRKVIREKGGIEGEMRMLMAAWKAKDVDTLKNLLGSKIWQTRLRSLQVLENLLAQKPDELREAASLLKDDENPSVREKAREILARG